MCSVIRLFAVVLSFWGWCVEKWWWELGHTVWEKGDKDLRQMRLHKNLLSWFWNRHVGMSSWCILSWKNVHKCLRSVNEHSSTQITKYSFPLEGVTAPWRNDRFQMWSNKHTSRTLSILSYRTVKTLKETIRVLLRGLNSTLEKALTYQRGDKLSFKKKKNISGFK